MLSKTICLTKAFNVNSKQQIKQMPNDVIHRLLRHNRAHQLHSSGPPIGMSTKHPMLVLLSQVLRRDIDVDGLTSKSRETDIKRPT